MHSCAKICRPLTASFFLLLAIALLACSAPKSELMDSPIVKELQQGQANGTQTFDHGAFNTLLARHVVYESGTVNYAGLKAEEGELDAYLGRLEAATLSALPRGEQLALLINAYNAYTLKLILENYPGVASIRDLSNPWSSARYKVGGHVLSLDNIEHNLIRPLYKDPRIHFAVNCAARSCPPLAPWVFEGPRVEEQLQTVTIEALTSPRLVRVEDGKLHLTKILDWYASDFTDASFTGHQATVAAYVARYATDEVRAFIESKGGEPGVLFMDYDWGLNDAE